MLIGKQGLLGKVEWWEPNKSRGLRSVLRAAEGEVPFVDLPEGLEGQDDAPPVPRFT